MRVRASRGRRASGGQRVVAALAVRRADRVDRGEVDDVEAHRGDRGQPLRRPCAACRSATAGLVVAGRALGAREDLVPGAGQRERAVHAAAGRSGDVVTWSRSGCAASTASTSGDVRGREPGRAGRVASRSAVTASLERVARRPAAAPGGAAAPLEHERRPRRASARRRCSAGTLIVASCSQVPYGSDHALDAEAPPPSAVGDEARLEQVQPGTDVDHAGARGVRAVGRDSTAVAPTASCPSRNTVARIGTTSPTTALRGPATLLDDRADLDDGDPADAAGRTAGWGRSGGSPRVRTYRERARPRVPWTRTRPSRRPRARPLTRRPTTSAATLGRRESHPPIHRPHLLPAALADLDELARNLRWSWHAPTRDLFARIDPARWAAVDGDPVALLGALAPASGSPRSPPTTTSSAGCARPRDDLRPLPQPSRAGTRAGRGAGRRCRRRSPTSRPSSASRRCCRSTPAAWASSPATTSRAPPTSACRSSASACCTAPGTSGSRSPATAGRSETYPRARPGRPAAHPAARGGRHGRRASPLDLPGGRTLHAHVWAAAVGPRAAAAARLRRARRTTRPRARSPTASTAAAASTGCSRSCCSASAACAALRAWSRLTGAPAPEVFHTNEGHAGFLGVERIRELVTARGLGFDEALEAVRAGDGVHHAHPGAGRHRPVRASTSSRSTSAATAPLEGVPVDRVLALGAEDYPGGDPTVFNMAVMGLRLGGRANGVSLLHGEVSRGMFDALWPGFDRSRGADHLDHQRRARARPGSTGG